MKRRACIWVLLAASALPYGCQDRREVPAVTLGSRRWLVDLATTRQQRYTGLSERQHLGENVGMLFIYPQPKVLEFCMRGCYIPLDIAFLDADRRVVAMHTMAVEPDLAGRAVYSSDVPAQYALEVGAGQLARAGVHLGDRADFSPAIPPPAKAEPGL